ncbi:hypothetical protein AWJ20_2069 [Sugiyamaella lignohabitans]|uniref:RRM domain-containing protein n=1 Tax=Sugiyamaella lignohabitans TaxID=796027 RepID=A0A161HLW0_9ASCO|nr:uncharacterized protein AWJ20_2069 [Sugiyamaella lignohabitans]ANB14477.1 hypothetical protein AWJ20_2069 [Sugiyamaella lignohabitans]
MGVESLTICSANLDKNVTKEHIYSLFLPFGPIVDVVPVTDPKHGFRGSADIEFETEEDAAAAIDNMEGAQVFGKTLHVRLSRKDLSEGAPRVDMNKALWAQDHEQDQPSTEPE